MELKDNGELLMSAISKSPLNELVAKISEPLKETISSAIKDNSVLYNKDGFKQVSGWIQESNVSAAIPNPLQNPMPVAGDSKPSNVDSILSGLANKIIANLMQHVPNYLGQMLLDNVKIQTQGKEKSMKFDLNYILDPIKPYVEFVKKANGVDVLKLKALFQIDSDIKMSDLGFLSSDDQRMVHLGNLVANLKISLLEFGFSSTVMINEPKVLLEQEFEKDLSEIKLHV